MGTPGTYNPTAKMPIPAPEDTLRTELDRCCVMTYQRGYGPRGEGILFGLIVLLN